MGSVTVERSWFENQPGKCRSCKLLWIYYEIVESKKYQEEMICCQSRQHITFQSGKVVLTMLQNS